MAPNIGSLETAHSSVLSSQRYSWQNLVVEQFQLPPGEASCQYNEDHTVYLSLASRPVRLRQVQDGRPYSGLYAKGDISISPVKMPVFARWEDSDCCLQIRLADSFLKHVASETLEVDSSRLELFPVQRVRDLQIESIGIMLFAELRSATAQSTSSKLYVESLTNVLAVHLLRQYTAFNQDSKFGQTSPVANRGLSKHQLEQTLNYIQEHLHEDISLANLAVLLKMSQFHFVRLFKQSLNISPYQYVLQQRIEQAKQLLKHTSKSITEIVYLCGFNNHSHFSKQFRQTVGASPRDYRTAVRL